MMRIQGAANGGGGNERPDRGKGKGVFGGAARREMNGGGGGMGSGGGGMGGGRAAAARRGSSLNNSVNDNAGGYRKTFKPNVDPSSAYGVGNSNISKYGNNRNNIQNNPIDEEFASIEKQSKMQAS